MEKWKIGLIAALICGFAALQWFGTEGQQPAGNTANQIGSAPVETPTPMPELVALKGKTPVAWNIPKELGMNTKQPIKLADLKGSVTLIEFWRLNCSHCQEAVPFMNELHRRYTPRGLKIVTFQSPSDPKEGNIEHDWVEVQKFARSKGIEYPIAFDTDRKLKEQYKIDYYPLLLIVDRQGKIQFAQTGHTEAKVRELVTTLDRVMNQK